jgi:UDP-N-acetylmuramoyl-tripeptide--D-alanyl-D-alanine ligase
VRDWSPEQVAAAAGAALVGAAPAAAGAPSGPPEDPSGAPGPLRATIDSREVRPGDLFVGLPGANTDGGRFAAGALAAGAWGALVSPRYADDAIAADAGVVLVADDPLLALQALARAWRRELGAQVLAITGSTGKTSTKDLLAAMLRQDRSVVASPQNYNTEIGMPLTILGAPPGTEALVLEMAMRGAGQIAELAAIAEPDVGVIVNVGPVHLEIMRSLEAIAAAKAELLASMRPGATAVLPAHEPLLDPHRRDDLRIVTFGAGGDVAELGELELPFTSAHMRSNALAALAAAGAVGARPAGMLEVELSALRGQRVELPGPVVVIDDCYNANPMSMRAALDDLAASASGRRVAVLGDMLELGADEIGFHEQIGAHAAQAGVDVLIAVGPLAAHMGASYGGELHAVADAAAAAALAGELVRTGDTVLVKASRGVGLEVVCEGMRAAAASA